MIINLEEIYPILSIAPVHQIDAVFSEHVQPVGYWLNELLWYPALIAEDITSSPFKFYLTGHRFFESNTRQSSWDFLVTETSDVFDFITKHGFSHGGNDEEHFAFKMDPYQTGLLYTRYREIDRVSINIRVVPEAGYYDAVQHVLKDYYADYDDEIRPQFPKNTTAARAVWRDALEAG